MTTGLPLFDMPIARTSDPLTSHLAAAETAPKVYRLQRQFADMVAESAFPVTASEAAERAAQVYGGLAETYRKRAAECVRLGLLKVVGVRVCSVTGKKATVYSRS